MLGSRYDTINSLCNHFQQRRFLHSNLNVNYHCYTYPVKPVILHDDNELTDLGLILSLVFVYVMLCCMICLLCSVFVSFSKYLLNVCIDYQMKRWTGQLQNWFRGVAGVSIFAVYGQWKNIWSVKNQWKVSEFETASVLATLNKELPEPMLA